MSEIEIAKETDPSQRPARHDRVQVVYHRRDNVAAVVVIVEASIVVVGGRVICVAQGSENGGKNEEANECECVVVEVVCDTPSDEVVGTVTAEVQVMDNADAKLDLRSFALLFVAGHHHCHRDPRNFVPSSDHLHLCDVLSALPYARVSLPCERASRP